VVHILAVDDDDETLELVERALQREGHRVLAVRTPAQALKALDQSSFELMILDVMLSDASGLDLCVQLRQAGIELPILFLSARGAVAARIEGLNAGADDYLAKPFALRELFARVRALGRRGPAVRPERVIVGELSLEFTARRARASGHEIPITQREWDILRALADAKGRVVLFDVLLERVWGEATESARASLDVIVSRLRKKLDAAANRAAIRTTRGVGYSLEIDP
jgi:two-component system OmpR family response regulator